MDIAFVVFATTTVYFVTSMMYLGVGISTGHPLFGTLPWKCSTRD